MMIIAMKYLRILIVVLLLALAGIGGYYAYLVFGGPKREAVKSESPNPEKDRPFQFSPETEGLPASARVKDFRSADLAGSSDVIKIQGRFQVIDAVEIDIDGTLYTNVLGILDDSGTLSRIYLTAGEYEQVGKDISDKNILLSYPVLFTLSQNGVGLERLPVQ